MALSVQYHPGYHAKFTDLQLAITGIYTISIPHHARRPALGHYVHGTVNGICWRPPCTRDEFGSRAPVSNPALFTSTIGLETRWCRRAAPAPVYRQARGKNRSRTRLDGFAGRCITALLTQCDSQLPLVDNRVLSWNGSFT